jgi:hypothetical protein
LVQTDRHVHVIVGAADAKALALAAPRRARQIRMEVATLRIYDQRITTLRAEDEMN